MQVYIINTPKRPMSDRKECDMIRESKQKENK